MGVSPLPSGTGVAVGFAAGLAIGMALGPIGMLALPLILRPLQVKPMAGGQSDVMGSIIIPVDESGETISPVFTRSPKFLIIIGDRREIIDNPYANTPGNAAMLVARMLMQYRPRKVIVRNIGRNAEAIFKMYGVDIEVR